MALDSRFIIASDLQSLFRDKDSGLPLRNGVIYFWQDAARTVPKNVYKLSGSPPNYSYTAIGAVINLTASGTISDNGNPANDIILYYFPYEGTPDASNGTVELYYVEVYSEGGKTTGVLQFTREAWPNIATSTNATQNLQNYIPNGQFKIHSDVEVNPDDLTGVAGQISQATTNLAQGGWTFDRPDMSAAKDIVLFKPFGSYVTNPTASPTYYIQIANESPAAGDSFKDLRIKFDDVNKFASDTQTYTFAFTGQSNSGSINVALILIKNYGSGGDTTEEISLANFVVTNSFSIIQQSGFTFGDNAGKVIGAGNYLQLALRFPTGSLFSANLTDFILTPGNVTVTQFPQTTDRQFTYQSITPAIPAYDSSQLYLTVRLGPQGLIYDNSEIGEVVAESNPSIYINSLHPTTNKMLFDGSQYETAAHSPLGIPYSRLQSVYWNNTLQLPIYGTGPSYLLSIINAAITSQMIITNNSSGSVTNASDGTPATGFTFGVVHMGASYACRSWVLPTNGFVIENTQAGTVTAASTPMGSGYSITREQIGDSVLPEITAIGPGMTTTPGTYFTFNVYTGGGDFGYYVWFQVDGMGTDPMVMGRTGILVNLTGGDTPAVVSQKISFALNTGNQVQTITTVAASAIPSGAYFNLISTGNSYYVWYKKDGAGTDPKPTGKLPIEVDILSADTAAQVASKTQRAINYKYFAVPDYRGYFLRGYDPTSLVDINNPNRFSFVPGIIGAMLGTTELDDNKEHIHAITVALTSTSGSLGNIVQTVEHGTPSIDGAMGSGADVHEISLGISVTNSASGSAESRPINKNVNLALRY